jgi:FAD/FMN-containing dehydrogenase
MQNLAEQISNQLGEDRVLSGEAVSERATSYWNSEAMTAKAILLPRSTEEVSMMLRLCHAANQTVVTQGGLTGCVMGAEPASDDIVISLEKMNRIEEIDVVNGIAVVEAGTVLQQVQESALDEGLFFPLDLGARGSCTIGGNVATNAGGINVLRYGMMRNLVLGLEAVLVDGTVISSMNQMLKNNAGYDIKQLFIGTEGTLGIITRVVLRLFHKPASRQDALVAMEDFDGVVGFLAHVQKDLGGALSAFEIMWGDYFKAVTEPGGHRAPMDREYPFYVVLQAEGGDPDSDADRFESVLGDALEKELIVDAVLPKSDTESLAIWEIREDFENILQPEPVYLYDISLPIRHMPAYVDDVARSVLEQWPSGDLFTIGHVADGNLHFFVRPNEPGDLHGISDECVYTPLASYSGSVSAEHGIGIEKIKWLSHSRGPAEIELMRSMKKSLDPRNLLNPGRVLGAG